MTSEQIKEASHIDLSTNAWLKEIAYQLAMLNEKQTPVNNQQLIAQVQRRK